MNWFVAKWNNFVERLMEAVGWLSVQVTAAWGVAWIVFSQLPANVILELTAIKWLSVSFVSWMGIAQTITTVMARVKKPKEPAPSA